MFCWNCGKQIADDSLFCTECGTRQDGDVQGSPQQPVNQEQPVYEEQPVYQVPPEQGYNKTCAGCGSVIPLNAMFCPVCNCAQYAGVNQTVAYPDNKNNKKRGRTIGIIVGIVLAVLAVFIFAGLTVYRYLNSSVDLNDYINVYFEGYDTVGTAHVEFDYDAFSDKYGKKLYKAYDDSSSFFGLYSDNKPTDSDYYDVSRIFVDGFIGWSLDKDSELRNGDSVTLTWSCDEDNAREIWGYKLKYEDVSYTVSGLDSVGTFDPFEGLSVTFEGVSPNGYINIDSSDVCEEAQDFEYYADSYEDLEVGDTVTVYVSLDYEDDIIDYCTSNFGKIPSVTEKEYVVEGLDRYITSLSDITPDCEASMQSQASDVYQAYIANNWGDDQKLKNFLCLGYYLLTSKSDSSDNILYLVYKVQVHNKFNGEDGRYNAVDDVYWYISYEDIMVDTEGNNIIDITDYGTPYDGFYIDSGVSDGWWSTKNWYYTGYQSIESMYNSVVASQVDEYSHEERIDETLLNSAVTVPDNEPEDNTADAVEAEEGIIFPQSSVKKISTRKIKALSDKDLQSAINEIYAREGYRFKDDDIRAFYEQFDWYEPRYDASEFKMSFFNKIEKANVQNMQKERDKRK